MENYMQQQEFSEAKNRIGLFESEFEDGWFLQKLVKENSPSFPKRRRVEDDAQSCISSRTDSPVSVDSFMDESFCPTPTDSPSTRVATLSDFRKHYKKDELWAAIESNYQYLMDDEIIETCRSTESDLSLDDEDTSINPNVSFQEFMQQYQELDDWLNQIQAFTQRKVMSRSEKYLNQTYHEELLQRSPRHKLLNDYARQLLKRYPALKGDVYVRLQLLNTQWQNIEQAISPSKRVQDWTTMLNDLKADIDHLRKWLQGVENRLLPLCIRNSWSTPELEEKLTEHQILQKDIESHLRVVSAVLKLGECLKNGKNEDKIHETSITIPESLNDISHSLEKRWHTIWLQSLEWQCRLEQAIISKKKSENPNQLSAFSPIKFWGQTPLRPRNLSYKTHYESSEDHVHDVGGSSLSDQGDESDCKLQTKLDKTTEATMPGKPNKNNSIRSLNDKQTNSLVYGKHDDFILSMNRENMFLEKAQLCQDNANPFKTPEEQSKIGTNILPNSPLQTHKFYSIKNPPKVGNINSSNQHFYQMVSLDTDWSTDSTHDDNIPKFSNYSFNRTTDSGVIADISNNNIQNQSRNFSEHIDKPLQIETISSTADKICYTPKKSSTGQSSGKEVSTASDSGTDKSPDMSIETTTPASESCSSSQKSKRKIKKGHKPAFSSCSSWSGGDVENAVESSCDASGEESGDSDGSDEFSTATEDCQENIYERVMHPDYSLCNGKINSAKVAEHSTFPIQREGKRNKERPWSVIELYEQSNGLDLKPFFISESALDQLHSQDTITPTKNNHAFDYASSTFPRLKRKEKLLKSLHATSDDALSHPGVKRKLQNDFPKICQILSSLSHENLTRQNYRSESESETKELARQLQNTTVCSGTSDTESESGGAYGTAMEDTSDGEYFPGSNGSFSETAWDNYQAPLYPTVSDEATEPALQWSGEMEFEEELSPLTTNTIITQVVAKRSDEDSGKSSRLAHCEDSDSDLDDFYHVLDESSNQLKVTDHALQKKKKDTGLYLNTGRYTELLATCQTNIKCLEVIYQHLNSATPVSMDDLDHMQGLLYQWEKLRALAVERQSQCRELCLINTNLITVYNWLQELSSLIKKEQFKGLPDAQQIINITQEKQALFEEKMSKLNELKESVLSFKEQHPTISVDGFLMKIGKCITELNSLRDKCATKLPQLQKYLLVWYDYNETKRELDYMLKQQRQQLDDIVYHLEVDLPKHQPNVQNDLRAVQKCLSLCQEKLDQLQACRLQLTCYLDRSACAGISADYSEYRSLLFAIKQQCQKSIAKAARLNSNRAGIAARIEYPLQASNNCSLGRGRSLVFPSHITATSAAADLAKEETNIRSENGTTTSSAVSLPRTTTSSLSSNLQNTWHGLVLVCVAGLVYLADPEALENLINFSIQLNPELRHINGAPPI